MANLTEEATSQETERIPESLPRRMDTPVSPYSRFRPFLLHFVRERVPSKLRSKINPSDVFQETALELHKRGVELRDKDEKWQLNLLRRAMIFRLSNLIRHFEQKGRMPTTHESSFEEMIDSGNYTDRDLEAIVMRPSELVSLKEREDAIRAALNTFPPLERTIVELRMFNFHGFDEIAEQLHLSKSKVRVIHDRTLKALRVQLREFDPSA